MAPLSEQLYRLAGIELQELSGSAVGGEIPLPVPMVNRLIAKRMATMQGPVGGVELQAHDGQRLTATVSLRGQSLVPMVKLAARIEQQPDFPRNPVLGLRWSMPGLGPLARFAAPALSFFKALPAGVRMEGDRVAIDLGALLRAQGLAEVADHLTRLHVETREGSFVVRFEARI